MIILGEGDESKVKDLFTSPPLSPSPSEAGGRRGGNVRKKGLCPFETPGNTEIFFECYGEELKDSQETRCDEGGGKKEKQSIA
jgi:hypothetical protein